MKTLLILLAATTVAFSQTAPVPVKLYGSIFIVTKGSLAIKMPLVEVCFYKVTDEQAAKVEKLNTALKLKKKEARELSESYEVLADAGKLDEAKVTLEKSRDLENSIFRDRDTGLKAIFGSELPQTVKSNADGQFSIKLKGGEGKYIVSATTYRRLSEMNHESYDWFFPMTITAEQGELMLCNDNLF